MAKAAAHGVNSELYRLKQTHNLTDSVTEALLKMLSAPPFSIPNVASSSYVLNEAGRVRTLQCLY